MYVYLVRCSDNSLYTGVANNISKRLDQHNGVKIGGAKYTKPRRPVTLVYFEKHTSKEEAMKREYAIKQLTHDQKEQFIQRASKEDLLKAI